MVSEVNIFPIKPCDGLVAFASVVLDGKLFLGSIGVHKRLDGHGYRLTYPTKKIGTRELDVYHPINRATGRAIEEAITEKCSELFERSNEDDRYNTAADTD
jgi:DNA-binding cell septation regulator SpoVG